MIRQSMLATALVALALPAAAQDAAAPAAGQGTFSMENVRSLFEDLETRSEAAVSNQAWQDLQAWAETHVAEDGNFAVEGSMVAADGPVVSYQVAMDGRDLRRLTAIPAMMQRMGGGLVSEYSLDATVETVDELPGGAGASAFVRIRETGVISPPEAAEETGATGAAGVELEPKTFDSMAQCGVRLGDEGGTLVIRSMACTSHTMM